MTRLTVTVGSDLADRLALAAKRSGATLSEEARFHLSRSLSLDGIGPADARPAPPEGDAAEAEAEARVDAAARAQPAALAETAAEIGRRRS